MDKIASYVSRGQNNIYKKRVMRISHSKVLQHPKEEILKNIDETDRWKDVFKFEGDKIKLDTYKDVENLIDLLDERFTVSPITGEEYDTDVKKPAERIGNTFAEAISSPLKNAVSSAEMVGESVRNAFEKPLGEISENAVTLYERKYISAKSRNHFLDSPGRFLFYDGG